MGGMRRVFMAAVLVASTCTSLVGRPQPAGAVEIPWESLGGSITSAPDITQFDGALHFFARGLDGAVWTTSFTNHSEEPWHTLGGKIIGGPSVAGSYSWDEATEVAGPSRIDLVARGVDNAVWHRHYNSQAGWSPWQSLGGIVTAEPAVHVVGDPFLNDPSWVHRINVFGRGQDGALWSRTFADGTWGPWRSLGGLLIGGPGAGGHPGWYGTVTVHGVDNAAWYRAYDWESGAFYPWNYAGGGFTDDLTAEFFCTPALFGRGNDGAIWHAVTEPHIGWRSLGRFSRSAPGTHEWFWENFYYVAIRGADNALWWMGDYYDLDVDHCGEPDPVSTSASARGSKPFRPRNAASPPK